MLLSEEINLEDQCHYSDEGTMYMYIYIYLFM